jgi:hypothetical protein
LRFPGGKWGILLALTGNSEASPFVVRFTHRPVPTSFS